MLTWQQEIIVKEAKVQEVKLACDYYGRPFVTGWVQQGEGVLPVAIAGDGRVFNPLTTERVLI